jgi:hypothetical protein
MLCTLLANNTTLSNSLQTLILPIHDLTYRPVRKDSSPLPTTTGADPDGIDQIQREWAIKFFHALPGLRHVSFNGGRLGTNGNANAAGGGTAGAGNQVPARVCIRSPPSDSVSVPESHDGKLERDSELGEMNVQMAGAEALDPELNPTLGGIARSRTDLKELRAPSGTTIDWGEWEDLVELGI